MRAKVLIVLPGIALLLFGCGAWPGSTSAAVEHPTLELISDPQCGACRNFYLENLLPASRDFGDRIQIVHRVYPISYHEHAREAALYVVAAGRLGPEGRHRISTSLFEHQPEWAETGEIRGALAKDLPPAELAVLDEAVGDPATMAALEREMELIKHDGLETIPTAVFHSGGKHQQIPSTVQYPIFRRFLRHNLEN